MITETNEYKGRQFKCDSCGYVVSSNAMSDFDVDDFSYCPYCGKENESVLVTLENALACATDDVTYKDLEYAINAVKEIQAYRAIGTIDEVKALKENQRKCEDCAVYTDWKCDCANERAYAIDEFAEAICDKVSENSMQIMVHDGFKADIVTIDYVSEIAVEIAEELKGGAE